MVKESLQHKIIFKNIFESLSYFKFFILIFLSFLSIIYYAYLKGEIEKGLFIFELSFFFLVILINLFVLKNKYEFYNSYLRFPKSLGIINCIPIGYELFTKKDRKKLTPWNYIIYGNIFRIERRNNDLKLIYSGDNNSFIEMKNLKENDIKIISKYFKKAIRKF